MNAGFNLNSAYKGTPFIGGSLQDVSAMQFVYQGAPFLIANQTPGAKYSYDVRGRLSQIQLTNLTTIVFSYDAMGNRTSVVSTCGPSGC